MLCFKWWDSYKIGNSFQLRLCVVNQSCLTLCSLRLLYVTVSLGSSVHADSPGKNTGVVCRALLQVIFPTQGLNPGLPHYRHILYQLNHQGSQEY